MTANFTDEEEQYLYSLSSKGLDCYMLAEKLNKTVKDIVSWFDSKRNIDLRGQVVERRKRALNRYCMIRNRMKNTERSRNRTYKNKEFALDKEEFVKWFMENDFKGASVDRIDNTKGYTMDNLQLLPIKDNISKDHRKAVNGSCECYVCHEVKPLEEIVDAITRNTGVR